LRLATGARLPRRGSTESGASVRVVTDEDEADQARSRYAGYIPYMGIGLGSAVGAMVAGLFDSPTWVLAFPGMVGGYFLSGAILRRVYSDNE